MSEYYEERDLNKFKLQKPRQPNKFLHQSSQMENVLFWDKPQQNEPSNLQTDRSHLYQSERGRRFNNLQVRDASFLWGDESNSPQRRDDIEDAEINDSEGETRAQIIKYRNTIANKFQSPPRHHHPAEAEAIGNQRTMTRQILNDNLT